jgi:hypothetical protein
MSIEDEGAIVTSVPVNWVLTMTVSPAEQSETGEEAESVTLYEKVAVDKRGPVT